MTRLQKIRNSLFGIAMMVVAVVMAYKPKDAYASVIVFMALGFFVSSVATLGYYFTMAKYMVGGRMILYRGVVLFDFAILGGVYAEVIGNMPRPKLGVLNIGEEETKGNETLQKLNNVLNAHRDALPYEYLGFVEPTDISAGRVQVVVTDGFTGNIVLKTVEGTAKLIKRVISENMKKSWLAIIGAFFLVHVFKRLKHKIDPRSYAGATFLGLKGFAVKTHGNSDALAFANAIQYAFNLAKNDLNETIRSHAATLAPIRTELQE